MRVERKASMSHDEELGFIHKSAIRIVYYHFTLLLFIKFTHSVISLNFKIFYPLMFCSCTSYELCLVLIHRGAFSLSLPLSLPLSSRIKQQSIVKSRSQNDFSEIVKVAVDQIRCWAQLEVPPLLHMY